MSYSVYQARDVETGHAYVGCTRVGVDKRFAQHVQYAPRSDHPFHVRLRERGRSAFALTTVFMSDDRLAAYRRERQEILGLPDALRLNVVKAPGTDPVDFRARPAAYTRGPAHPDFMAMLREMKSRRRGRDKILAETGMPKERWDELMKGAAPLYLEIVSISLALQILTRRDAKRIGWTELAELPLSINSRPKI